MNSTEVRFLPSGDRAVTMEFGQIISPKINDDVLRMHRALKEHPVQGIVETVPTYRSLLVLYEKEKTEYKQLCERLLEIWKKTQSEENSSEKESRIWKIPCCYGSHFGLDLAEVCRHTGLSREEVIRRHSSVEYRIYMLGFLPGFVYLGGMDPDLAIPRRKIPRKEIPKGSVGIGGSQTGIYPLASPGGWQLIGCTPVDLYDPNREEPVFFRAGDRVRFYPINSCEYYDIRRSILNKQYVPERISENESNVQNKERYEDSEEPNRTGSFEEPFIEILRKGLLTTVQDGGRIGYRSMGVPESGVMDRTSFYAANALLGNDPEAAVLEMTMLGDSLRFLRDGRIAMTGADMNPMLNGVPAEMGIVIPVHKGDILEMGAARKGCRTYLAADGGIRTPKVMGSRSTYIRCGIGGLEGRALKHGDRLSAGMEKEKVKECRSLKAYHTLEKALGEDRITLRVIPGPQEDHFTEKGIGTFYSEEYTLTPECDRMGCRLDGPVIESIAGTDIISDGVLFGSVQITGAGKPIVLMADCQTTGGYAKIATVVSEDLPLLAQAVPGTTVRFQKVSEGE